MNEHNMVLNSENVPDESLSPSNIATPRVIKKLTKRPPMKISPKAQLPCPFLTAPVQISKFNIESSIPPELVQIVDSSNILHATKECTTTKSLEMKHENVKSSVLSNVNSLSLQHDAAKDSSPSQENIPSANNRLSSLLTKLRQYQISTLASSEQQSVSQNDSHQLEMNQENEKSLDSLNNNTIREQSINDINVTPLKEQNSQCDNKNWSLSPKLWPPDKVSNDTKQITKPNVEHTENSPQPPLKNQISKTTAASEPSHYGEPIASHSNVFNLNQETEKSPQTLTPKNNSQNESIATSNDPPKPSRTSILLQKLKALQSPSKPDTDQDCRSPPALSPAKPLEQSSPPPSKPFSPLNKPLPTNTSKITTSKSTYTCYNCGSNEHKFNRCPRPVKSLFCHTCGWENVNKRNCPFCTGRLVRPGSSRPVPVGGDKCRKYDSVDIEAVAKEFKMT